MVLAQLTWPEVEAASKDVVVLIPTGAVEQHGPHLPLGTDALIVTAFAEGVEAELREHVLLTPTLWLGASSHHLPFPGTLSASFDPYAGALRAVILSLHRHGFWKFYVLNGHGGNSAPNEVALRDLKAEYPNLLLGSALYTPYAEDIIDKVMAGPVKELQHACEAEASLMMHLHPNLVRKDRLRDDGLGATRPVRGMIHHFDEITEQGSWGYATLARPDKGRAIFEETLEEIVDAVRSLADGSYRLER